MTTHIIIRITADARPGTQAQYAAYGPITKSEALELMQAGRQIFQDLKLYITPSKDGRSVIGWRKGSAIMWKLLLVELRPGTEDICEGIN